MLLGSSLATISVTNCVYY